ncbi:MAG: hypothetical protein OHK0012_20130 [Synechococcales cyanobacterium]
MTSQTLARPTGSALTRRQQLQRQRSQRFWQTAWQVSLSFGILGGLVTVVRQPVWHLNGPDQIQIRGNHRLTSQDIQDRLELAFPLTLWQVEPHAVSQSLIPPAPQLGLIESVHLQRHMFPPSVTVWVEERPLLAQAWVDQAWGVIDDQGHWIPLPDVSPGDPRFPQVQVQGWEQLSANEWATFLPRLLDSPVAVETVIGSATEGVILKTELGRVHLGSLSVERLDQQLHTLAQMQNLQTYCQCSPDDIQYIDLTSPTRPTLELTAVAMERRL